MSTRQLLDLQERIHSQLAQAAEQTDSLLIFAAANAVWAIEFASVAAVTTCGQVTPLWSRQGLPESVIGISSSGEDILTVIDSGLVLGANPTRLSLKSRLITFTSPALKGVALLVDRVLDPMSAPEVAAHADTVSTISAASLSQKITQGDQQ